jgi:hypothetical protein
MIVLDIVIMELLSNEGHKRILFTRSGADNIFLRLVDHLVDETVHFNTVSSSDSADSLVASD